MLSRFKPNKWRNVLHKHKQEHEDEPDPEPVDNSSPPWAATLNLSAQVPVAGVINDQQRPTLVWIVQVGKVAIRLVLNGMKVAESDVEKHPLVGTITKIETVLNDSIYLARKSKGDPGTIGAVEVTLSTPDAKASSPKDISAEINDFLKQLGFKGLEHVGLQKPSPPTPKSVTEETLTLQDYKDIFSAIPLPEVANTFQTDETFVAYRIAGPNPMSLKCVTKLELNFMVGHRITDEQFNAALGTTGDSVEAAGESGRLCVVNYRDLSGMDPVVVEGRTFVTDPIAVFAEPSSGGAMKPIAIQIGQDPTTTELIFAQTPDTWRWQMAKTIVQTADCIYHEAIAHLAHTHLVMEAFSVATQRRLSPSHPIYKLLMPHIEGTNFINNAAATSLINFGGPIDSVFCNDSDSRLRSIQSVAARSRFAFDFINRAPDVELKLRRVTQLSVYPYRDDILLLWDAIKSWATDYVNLYYHDDKAVTADAELSAWSLDLSINGSIMNFDPPTTKQSLIFTLSMAIHLASAQHAAVNYPQQSHMSFVPAMTGAVWDEFPPLGDGHATEEQWLQFICPLEEANEQLGITYLLGGVHYRGLGQYHSNDFPYFGTLDLKVKPALDRFNEELTAIETLINQRNKRRGHFKYTFLLPSNIPASINI